MGLSEVTNKLKKKKEEQQVITPVKARNSNGTIAKEFKSFFTQAANNINIATKNSLEELRQRKNQTQQEIQKNVAPVGSSINNKNIGLTNNNTKIQNTSSTLSDTEIEALKKKYNVSDTTIQEKQESKEKLDELVQKTTKKVNKSEPQLAKEYTKEDEKKSNELKRKFGQTDFQKSTIYKNLLAPIAKSSEDMGTIANTTVHSIPLAFQNIAHGIGQFEASYEKQNMGGVKKQNEINRALGKKELSTPNLVNNTLESTGIENNRKWQEEKIQQNSEKMNTKLGAWINEQIPSISQNLVSMAVSAVNPILGSSTFAASAFGGYYDDAINSGLTEKQAYSKAGIMSTFEFVSESVVTANTVDKVKGVASRLAGKTTEKAIKKEAESVLKDIAIDAGENFLQEAVMDPLEVMTDKYVKQEKLKASDIFNKEVLSQAFKDGVAGAFSSVLLFGIGAGLGSAENIVNKITSGEKIKTEDINKLDKEARKAGLNLKETVKQSSESVVDGLFSRILNNKEQLEQRQEIESLQANEKEKDIKELLNERIDNNKIEQVKQSQILAPAFNGEQQKNTLNIPQVEQTTRATAEVYKNAFKSDTERERIVAQLENIQNTRNKYNKKGTLNIVFDSTINGNGVIIADKEGNRTIKINPKTDKAAEFVLIHELTHDLKNTTEYNELENLVKSFNNKQFNYEEALQSIKNTYEDFYNRNNLDMSGLDTNEEAMADILGTALGNQQFVNQLAQKPTVFQRMKNWINKQIEIHKSSDKELTRWLYNVQDTFKKAIRENISINTNGVKYSIKTDNKGNKYVKVDTDQYIFENVNENEYSKIAKEYILNKFRDGNKKINLPTMEDVKVTSNTAREYTHPKNKLAIETKKSKMKASTELDNIIQISEYRYSRPDDGRHKIAKDGWDYYKTVFEVNGKKFEGLINIAKSGNKKTLYDITKIKELVEPYSTSDKSFSVSSTNSNNSITPTEAEVNTTNSNYTQESKKYSKQNSTVKYSIAGVQGMKNAIRNDSNNIHIENNYNQAVELKKQGKGNAEILKSTGWFQDKNGDWKFNFTDKEMSLRKDIKLKANRTYELSDILKHDTLFTAYPELANYKVVFEKQSASGAFNPKNNTISLNSSKLKNKKIMDIEKTLIHEIQHAIQTIEDYEKGRGVSKGKLRYYESLGEIEATDTADRFIKEKYKKENLKNQVPESAKKNPKHKNLEKYLNNRSIIDKIKDSVYSYFNNGGGNANEINYEIEKNISEDLSQNIHLDNERANGLEKSSSFTLPKNYSQDINGKWQEYLDFIDKKVTETKGKQEKTYFNQQLAPVKEIIQETNSTVRELKKEINDIKKNIASVNEDENVTIKDFGSHETFTVKDKKKQERMLTPITGKTSHAETLQEQFESLTNSKIRTERKKKKSFKDVKSEVKETSKNLYQSLVNKMQPIEDLAKKTGKKELKFLAQKTLTASGQGQYNIGIAQTDINGKVIGKSVNDIFQKVIDNGKLELASEYLNLLDNSTRAERGRPIYAELNAQQSKKLAEDILKENPEFKQLQKEVKKYQDNELKMLVDAGFISKADAKYIKNQNPYHVPIERIVDEKLLAPTKTITSGKGIKKAKGGNSDILSSNESIANRTMKLRRKIALNELITEMAKAKGKYQEIANPSTQYKTEMLTDTNISEEDLHFVLDGEMDVDTVFDQENDSIRISEDGKYKAVYFEDGIGHEFDITKGEYDALKQHEANAVEEFATKTLGKVSQFHKDMLTKYSLTFTMKNALKDIQDVAINTTSLKGFIKAYPKAMMQIGKEGDLWNLYLANGGGNLSYFDYNTGVQATKTKNPVKIVARAIGNVNEIVEQLPRFTEFISTLDRGGSINEAMYNAADITTNFARGGEITKALNRSGATFLNASVQGFDKFIRNFSMQNGVKPFVATLAKAAAFGMAPALLNALIYGDDDDYDRLPDSDKDLYYLFKKDDGTFIRIPKGRTLSVFGTAARRTLNYAKGDKEAFSGMLETVSNQVAPNNPITDNVIAPVVAAATNKNWYGGQIVSDKLQEQLPKNQYDESTDDLSIAIGKKIGVSPKKINYVIDQYSGGVGDILLPVMTKKASNKGNVFKDQFTTDPVLKNRYVSKFYDTIDKMTQITNDEASTEDDKLKLMYLNEVKSDVGELYNQKREIQNSDLSNKEKSKQVRELQKQINDKVEDALDNYEKINKSTKNIARIKDSTYVKLKGEWKTITDSDAEKIQKIEEAGATADDYLKYKIATYHTSDEEIDSKEKSLEKLNYIKNVPTDKLRAALYENTVGESDNNFKDYKGSSKAYIQYKIDTKEATEGSKNLKQNEKIDILLNNGYKDSDIKKIYENQIKSDEDLIYDSLKDSIDIKEYLKYKQQDFSSDKLDNGTLNGKTVAGSSQKKVYNYINNMNISREEKLILIGSKYKLTNIERTELAQYINTLSLSKKNKLELYSKMKGFTVYKDGRVTW